MGRSQADGAISAGVAALVSGAAVIGVPTAVVLGLAVFADPGYLLSQLLTGSCIGGLERVEAVTGLALVVPVLGGLLLYAAGVPLHRAGRLGLLAAVTLIGDVALFVRLRIGKAAPFSWRFEQWRMPLPCLAIFAAAILIAASALTLARLGVAVQPQPGFTQLWLAPSHQKAHTIVLGVSNDEGSTTNYPLAMLHNQDVSAAWNLTPADGQAWQRSVPFTGTYTLAANLYRLPDLAHPYRYVTTHGGKAI